MAAAVAGVPPPPEVLEACGLELLSQGAEARVWRGTFLSRPAILKERFRKAYRHPALDAQLTSSRLKAEVRGLARARRLGVKSPVPLAADVPRGLIWMDEVRGSSLKAVLYGWGERRRREREDREEERAEASEAGAEREGERPEASEAGAERGEDDEEGGASGGPPPPPLPPALHALLSSLGRAIARLHDGSLVHGDLTTSNVMVQGYETEEARQTLYEERPPPAADANAPETAADAPSAPAPGTAADASPATPPPSASPATSPPSAPLEVTLIDFGLSTTSTLPEDKGVDLYVLERAFLAAHAAEGKQLFDVVLDAYRRTSKSWRPVLGRFAEGGAGLSLGSAWSAPMRRRTSTPGGRGGLDVPSCAFVIETNGRSRGDERGPRPPPERRDASRPSRRAEPSRRPPRARCVSLETAHRSPPGSPLPPGMAHASLRPPQQQEEPPRSFGGAGTPSDPALQGSVDAHMFRMLSKNVSLTPFWSLLSTALSMWNKLLIGRDHGTFGGEPFPAPFFMSSV